MKVRVFAALKDYFETEFEIEEPLESVEQLKSYLAQKVPPSKGLLQLCRFAIRDNFIESSYTLHQNDYICIIPPSSGG